MNIFFTAAEAHPLAKAGGLGDVVGSLPKALRARGHDARVAIPLYATLDVDACGAERLGEFTVSFFGKEERIEVIGLHLDDGTPVYLIGNERYLFRQTTYGEHDDVQRFLLFSLAVMHVPRVVGWRPDVVHSHDWHTGLVPALLKIAYKEDPLYSACASVFTIHNLAYQGWLDPGLAEAAGLGPYLIPPDDPLREKTFRLTALGIYHADVISTVSENYAREILTPERGEGLEALLQTRQESLFGIVNGIDYRQFDPATDRVLPVNYDVGLLERRPDNKVALQKEAGLPVDPDVPLIGMAARLVDQKGIDIAERALTEILGDTNAQFVLQGSGDSWHESLLRGLEGRYRGKVRLFLALDFSIAHRIFAGCDIFLMPSRFEPCGLTPLIAMHYGAIPVVRRTGGLAQTVIDYGRKGSGLGIGFVFERYDPADLEAALRRALSVFENRDEWRGLVRRAMSADYSWGASVPRYEELYEAARRSPARRTSTAGVRSNR